MAFPTPATKTNCDASTDDPKQALLVDLATLIDKFNALLGAAAAAGPLASSGITGAASSGGNTDITSLDSLTAPTTFANPVRVSDLQSQALAYFTTGGSSTAYTLTPSPAITSLVAGQRFNVAFHATPGATPTLAISGLTAKNLKVYDGAGGKRALTSNDIKSVTVNHISDIVYDGTDYVVLDTARADQVVPVTFTSAAIAFSAGAKSSFAHGLGGVPTHVQAYLRCVIADVGYSAGDVMPIAPPQSTNSNISVKADSTNVHYYQGTVMQTTRWSDNAFVNLTTGNWEFFIVCTK